MNFNDPARNIRAKLAVKVLTKQAFLPSGMIGLAPGFAAGMARPGDDTGLVMGVGGGAAAGGALGGLRGALSKTKGRGIKGLLGGAALGGLMGLAGTGLGERQSQGEGTDFSQIPAHLRGVRDYFLGGNEGTPEESRQAVRDFSQNYMGLELPSATPGSSGFWAPGSTQEASASVSGRGTSPRQGGGNRRRARVRNFEAPSFYGGYGLQDRY